MASIYRPFQFFEKETVKDPFIEKLEITCSTCGRGHLFFGDFDGFIRVVDRNLKSETFQAYKGAVTHLKQLRSCNLLASLGSDGGETFKIWSLEKRDDKGQPQCIRSLKLFPNNNAPPSIPLRLNCNPSLAFTFRGNNPDGHHEGSESEIEAGSITSPITCFDIAEDLNCAAIGLTNGDILLFRGDLVRDRSPKLQILERPDGVLSTCSFVMFKKDKNDTALWAVYLDTTYIWTINSKGEIPKVLTEIGADLDCVCPCDSSDFGDIALARPDRMYFLQEGVGKGPSYPIDGEKRRVYWFRTYLAILSPDTQEPTKFTFTIYDLKNQLKVFSGNDAIFTNVSFILSEWGSIYVITNEPGPGGYIRQQMFRLEEKDTQTKLDALFKRNLYDIAVGLANTHKFDFAYIIEAFRKYGDYLYNKGDYDRAVEQYARTVGKLEASYVVRRFLDAQRIHNLTRYLEQLHQSREAGPDHTTLLLNCYTKLKDVQRLDTFIKETGLHYDVETAIRACNQAGYHQHALQLALLNKAHDWYVKILVDDVHQYSIALDYIKTLELGDAEQSLQSFGRVLIRHLPEETTQVLKDVCTAWFPRISDEEGIIQTQYGKRSRPELYITCFVDAPYYLMRFLELVVAYDLDLDESTYEDGFSVVWITLFELYLTDNLRRTVTNPNAEQRTGEENTPKEEEEESEQDKQQRHIKAMCILRNSEAKYDPEQALVLCQKYGFKEGMLYLLEKLHLHSEIIYYHMENNDYVALVDACKRLGDKNCDMWAQALTFFCQARGRDFTEYIYDIITHVDQKDLLPPMQVVEIMGRSDIKFDVLQSFLHRRVQVMMQSIEDDQAAIAQYKENTNKMELELKAMGQSAQLFQLNKCSRCHSALELPVMHFFCKHSFHHRCLGEKEECPICSPETRKLEYKKEELEALVDRHDRFTEQLKHAPDGFGVISNYFGRTLFNGHYNPPPVTYSDEDSD